MICFFGYSAVEMEKCRKLAAEVVAAGHQEYILPSIFARTLEQVSTGGKRNGYGAEAKLA
jgi:hypothetical protein